MTPLQRARHLGELADAVLWFRWPSSDSCSEDWARYFTAAARIHSLLELQALLSSAEESEERWMRAADFWWRWADVGP